MKRSLPFFDLFRAAIWVLAGALASASWGGERHALVIGNQTYKNARSLQNPVNDASDMAATLKGLGFAVTLRTDADLAAMKTGVREFMDGLPKTGSGHVALMFYAGHGVQIKGQNYLVPVDAAMEREFEVPDEAYGLESLMRALEAAGTSLNIVILDCCRDDPFGRGWSGSRGAGAVGLAMPKTMPKGIYLSFATAPGEVAKDGRGRNSPFTTALLKHIGAPGLEFDRMFRAVGQEVDVATGGQQRPWRNSDYYGEFYFMPGAEPPPPPDPAAATTLAVSRPVMPVTPPAPAVSETGTSASSTPAPMVARPSIEPPAGSFGTGRGMEGSRAGETRTMGGIEMVWCPAGEFQMGSPESEEDRGEDEVQHRVVLTRGFWLARTECTQGQWEAAMGSNPSNFKGADLPVEMVYWEDAEKYCEAMNRDYPLPEGWKWNLPTEAQWEYACRAGTTTPFSFGSALNGREANCDGNYPYGTSEKGPYLERTSDVGSYEPNAWGLSDMHGNVREWCRDWYGDYPTGSVTDPTGPDDGSNRVNRGGSWVNDAWFCRSAYRGMFGPDYRRLGFRVAVSSIQ